MYKRFRKLPLWGQFIVVMVLLIIGSALLPIVLGLIRALISFAILAAIIVGVLWIIDRASD